MKLWPTTTENKCFVKMLWHLLGEYVKTIVLLVCSICTFFFFFNHQFVLFFLISINFIKSSYAAIVFCHCSYNVFHCSSTVQFWWATLSFFFFFLVLNSSYNTRWHCSNSSYSFYFWSFVCTFFFLLYIMLYWHNKFHNIFTIIEVSISYKSKIK